MALPTTIDGNLIILSVGDGESPEVFTPICGMNTVSFNRTARTNDDFVRDCADPAEPAERVVSVTGKQADITASGYINTATAAQTLIEDSMFVSLNWRLTYYDDDGTTVLYHRTGPAKLIGYNETAPENGKSTAELTLASDGVWTRTTP